MKDNFSQQSAGYAQFRPGYPEELFEFIISLVPSRKTAWDAGTGNGQTAAALAAFFEKVIATDISARQLEQAKAIPNIFYLNEPAEKTSISDNSINLVTVSQALHWFDLDHFYSETRRVAAPGGIIAVWTYSLLHISMEADTIIREFHFSKLKDFWDPERKYVDAAYSNIPFPFEKMEAPSFNIKIIWGLKELEGYLQTWSAVQEYIARNNINPVTEVINQLKPFWPEEESKEISFPIHLIIARVHE